MIRGGAEKVTTKSGTKGSNLGPSSGESCANPPRRGLRRRQASQAFRIPFLKWIGGRHAIAAAMSGFDRFSDPYNPRKPSLCGDLELRRTWPPITGVILSGPMCPKKTRLAWEACPGTIRRC
jgi:hypothetical protein